MTQDEIIELAMAYGFTGGFNAQGDLTFDATFVEAVTEAVAKTRKATLEEMIYAHPTAAIKQAVEYEREACAKLAETPVGEYEVVVACGTEPTPHRIPRYLDSTSIAKSIRARGNK